MPIHVIINCIFISAGALILLISIIRARGFMEALSYVPEIHRKQVARALLLNRVLMIFFLCGYLVVLAALIFDYAFVSATFISLIFLFGAIFVLIGTLVQSRLLGEMQKTLQGILPICCKCKKIRSAGANPKDPAAWKGVEEYITEKTKVDFSHSYCPECFAEEMKTVHK